MCPEKPVRIAWGMAGYGPIWAPAYTSHLIAIAYASRSLDVQFKGIIGGVGCTDRLYTHTAENQLVHDFLDDPSYTHLFFTEQDMILPKETIPLLLAIGKPIVSGVYFLRAGNGQPCLFQKLLVSRENRYCHSPVSIFPTDRPFRVDCPGLGCVLFERTVFETIPPPWFQLKQPSKQSTEGYGSDMYFYTLVNDHHIETWATPQVMCGQIDYTVVAFEDWARRVKTDKEFVNKGAVIGGRKSDTLKSGLRA